MGRGPIFNRVPGDAVTIGEPGDLFELERIAARREFEGFGTHRFAEFEVAIGVPGTELN